MWKLAYPPAGDAPQALWARFHDAAGCQWTYLTIQAPTLAPEPRETPLYKGN